MQQKKSLKLRYLIVTFFAFFIAFIFFYGQTFEESIFTDGFPVPHNAKVINVSSEKYVESYEWQPASEENGLPLRYRLIIRLSGWTEVDRMGAMTTYEKDGKTIDVISQKNLLELFSKG